MAHNHEQFNECFHANQVESGNACGMERRSTYLCSSAATCSIKSEGMAALWRWQFKYQEYPESWYDPEEFDHHTNTFYTIPVEQLNCYLLRRPKSEVYLENFHAIRYLEIEGAYFSVDATYLKAGNDPPTVWRERTIAKEKFAKAFITDLLAMEYCTRLCNMPEEYTIDIPYSFQKYWRLRNLFRRKMESGADVFEEVRPHPAFGWRGLLWKMQQHRRKRVIWSALGQQLREKKMSLDVGSLSRETTFDANPSLDLPDDVVRDYRSKRAMLPIDFDLVREDGSRWNTGPVMTVEPYTARQLWFRAHTPLTRTTTTCKTRRSIEDQESTTNLENWKRVAEVWFGVSMDSPPAFRRTGSAPSIGR